MMPLNSSVAIGNELGFILPICLVAQKRYKEIHPFMYVLCLLFMLYFALNFYFPAY